MRTTGLYFASSTLRIDGASAELGKHAHAVRSLRLEESGLRLDRGDPSLRSLKAGHGKI